ncbi:zinc-dependent alcohol dehydrogenase [Candidatus Rariloculus sp.]|uniref:zinc-dependent alcohol dehydrogenase n=1 Tax=Candidatus Rariloculus sp. TaxID=3101265 RepID=UPI003D0C8815
MSNRVLQVLLEPPPADDLFMAMTEEDARAFWVTAPGRGEIRGEILRVPKPGEVTVHTLYSGISRGTEALVFSGRVPPGEYKRMRAPFQQGDFPAPVKYGYANVGTVAQGPSDLVGRVIFCLYPHQTRYIVPADSVHVLPEGLPPGRAVLAANLQTAVNGLWDAEPKVGDRICVIGAGTVGCLVAWLAARIAGCSVELVDVDPAKAETAAKLGVRFRSPPDAQRDADLVVHASGNPDGLSTALEIAGFEATIVELSWFGDRRAALMLGESFHSRRLTLKSSQVGTIAAAQRGRWSGERQMALVFDLLGAPELDALITGQGGFDDLPLILEQLTAEPGGTLCHRIVYA